MGWRVIGSAYYLYGSVFFRQGNAAARFYCIRISTWRESREFGGAILCSGRQQNAVGLSLPFYKGYKPLLMAGECCCIADRTDQWKGFWLEAHSKEWAERLSQWDLSTYIQTGMHTGASSVHIDIWRSSWLYIQWNYIDFMHSRRMKRWEWDCKFQ